MSGPTNLSVRVPGKAMLAGEYAVLAGAPGIVAAVDRHLVVRARAGDGASILSPHASWRDGQPVPDPLRFAHTAWRIAGDYLQAKGIDAPPLQLEIRDALRDEQGRKLGLGGSACTVVGVVAATIASAGVPLDKPLVFMLAAAAHAHVQQSPGSALDVAASTFGGRLWMRRFEADPILAGWKGGPAGLLAAVERCAPPELERLPAPARLLLIFTGQSASTPKLVEAMEQFRNRSYREWAAFVARSSEAADRLRRALLAGEEPAAVRAVDDGGRLLEQLGADSGLPLITPSVAEVIARARAAGAAAKISGAGGGDCCLVWSVASKLEQLAETLPGAFLCGVDEQGVRLE